MPSENQRGSSGSRGDGVSIPNFGDDDLLQRKEDK
jgi:hypothetical protein